GEGRLQLVFWRYSRSSALLRLTSFRRSLVPCFLIREHPSTIKKTGRTSGKTTNEYTTIPTRKTANAPYRTNAGIAKINPAKYISSIPVARPNAARTTPAIDTQAEYRHTHSRLASLLSIAGLHVVRKLVSERERAASGLGSPH